VGKWPSMLKQIAPGPRPCSRSLGSRHTPGDGQFAVSPSVAPSLGIALSPINVRDPRRNRAQGRRFSSPALARRRIVTASALAVVHRNVIVAVCGQTQLPAVYFTRQFVPPNRRAAMSYGSDWVDQHRRSATYNLSRPQGEKPADLPVQAPTEFQLVINLNTANPLGITMPGRRYSPALPRWIDGSAALTHRAGAMAQAGGTGISSAQQTGTQGTRFYL